MTTTTSTTTPTTPTITLQAIGLRMSSIGVAAESIRRLALDAQNYPGDVGCVQHLAALIDAIKSLACNIGMVADMTATDVGMSTTFGTPETWLLGPDERVKATAE